ncbi:hypothetical protein BTI679_30820 [Bacillus wiedmannii]|nr:hypothetical protein BTI679_30820 [Bacillus wiedmannii]
MIVETVGELNVEEFARQIILMVLEKEGESE